jgi:NADP-dependent 3-hydroxy acid dehydrogenase YdfG
MLLESRVALVYGAGGAIGGAVAKAFAREGARVVLAGRTAAKLEIVATAIRTAGGKAEVTLVDALDAQAVEAHLNGVGDRFGPVGVMFNCH